MRLFTAVTRLIPICDCYLLQEFLLRGADAFHEYRFDFTYRSLRLNILWSASAFPERLAKHMMFQGVYQHDVLLWIKRFCRKGDTVYDVGAFHGLMSVVASKAVGRTGKVVAFEPNPKAREHFLRHVSLNKCSNVVLESFALTDRENEQEFFIQRGPSTWNSSLVRDFVDPVHEVEPIHVKTMTLDAYVDKKGLVPSFVKIDTEGTEVSVLQGAHETICRHKPVLVLEFNPRSAAPAGVTVEGMTEFLNGLGYRLTVIPPTRWGHYKLRRAVPFDPVEHTRYDVANVLCLPETRQ
jgi:FkbM family methyltransferase